VPGRLSEPASLDARGEVYMPKSEFARINAEREERGLPLYANPRNSGAGSLRQKDPSVTAARQLATWSYQLLEDDAGARLRVVDPPGLQVRRQVDGVEHAHRQWRADRSAGD